MTTASNTVARNGGCGCGGSSTQNCGCGQGYASFTQPEVSDALMRPRFFPGQLLTEDDLGQLVSYMTAKSRLHNRFLFGDGVVAGLQVRRHPSSTRLVRVDAGYALDTNGDDIVVPCRQEIDIITMVRDLVQARLGVDCDPVSPQPQYPYKEGPTNKPLRQYGLYLRYHEKPAEPVAPYTTGDDPCAAQACQFSRVREGFVFELRCFEPLAHHGLQQALQGCLESRRPQVVWPKDLALIAQRAKEMRQALDRLPPEPLPATGEEPGRATYTLAQEDVAEARMLLKVGPLTDAPLEDKAEQLERAASLVARYDLSNKPEESKESFEELRRWIQGEGRPGLADEVLAESQGAELSPLVRKTVTVIATQAKQLTRSERTQDWGSLQHRLLAAGTALDETLRTEYQTAATTALRLPATRPLTGQPATETATLRADTASPQRLASELELRRTVEQLERASRQDDDYYRECICEVMNPPYTHPGDPAVLLARVDVRECDVVEICNMERRLVLSPAAVQYWVGGPLHGLLEQYCCGPQEIPHEGGQYSKNELMGALKGVDLRAGGSEVVGALLRMVGPAARPQTSSKAAAARRQSVAERSARAVTTEGKSELRIPTRPTEPSAPPEPARTSEPVRTSEVSRPVEPSGSELPVAKAPTAPAGPQEPTVTPGATRHGRGGTRGGGRRG